MNANDNEVVARIKKSGYEPVSSFNPYWNQHGLTFEDPDGYRVVLQHAAWERCQNSSSL